MGGVLVERERERDFARFMPTICHFAGIPSPGAADDSIQIFTHKHTVMHTHTQVHRSKYIQINKQE